MSMKTLSILALAGTALATPAFATDIDQLMKEINALKAQVNALTKKQAAAAAPAAPSGPVINTVKTCEAQDAGFFVIPGTTTCLRLSGYVRGESTFSQLKGSDTAAVSGDKSELGFGGRFRLNTDFRSSTELGTLRGFARLHLNTGSGSARSVGSSGADTNSVTSFSTTADLVYGYVTLGGLSVGRQDSAFLFYNGADAAFITSDDGAAPVAASYTMSLGSGLSATAAVENPLQRSIVKNGDLGLPTRPELVGALQYVNGPATFKLAGASHQVIDEDTSKTKEGYAVQGGLKYTLSADTTLWAQGTYAKGAMSYLGYGITGKADGVDTAAEANTAASTSIAGDASTDGQLLLSSGWSALIGVNQVLGKGNLALVGTYGDITNMTGGTGNSVEGKVTQIEVNYTYKPYAGVNFQPTIAFQRWDLENADTGAALLGSTDRYSVRLRAWREF